MKHIKLLNGALWVANALIGGAIVVYACQYLLFPEHENLLRNVVEDGGKTQGGQAPPTTDFGPLARLSNPVTSVIKDSGTPQSGFNAKLLGGYKIASDDASEVAFLLTSSNKNVNAYRGEAILHEGEVVAELRGWKLVRLTSDGAIFTDGTKEVPVRRDDAGGLATVGPGSIGKAFDMAQSKTKKLQGTDSTESWSIDRDEIQWAMQNVESLLTGVQLSAYPGGGVKIDAAGPVASQRGFMDGDVVRSVNGRGIRDRSDLINMASDPAIKNSMALTIMVERAGRPFTLDFRPGAR